MNNFMATAWWANQERKRHERRAEQYEDQAKRAKDPKVAERFRLDAQHERNKAKRFDTGIRF
jgi:rubrerythrin